MGKLRTWQRVSDGSGGLVGLGRSTELALELSRPVKGREHTSLDGVRAVEGGGDLGTLAGA